MKLDVDYLRYFDNDKVPTTCTVTLTPHHFSLSYWYSTSFISVIFITCVWVATVIKTDSKKKHMNALPVRCM